MYRGLKVFDMRKKHSILLLALAVIVLIAGTANAAKLVRHYRFQNPSNLGRATVGPDAASKSESNHIPSPGGWAFKKVPYLLQSPASAAPDSRMGTNAGCWFKTEDNTTRNQNLVFGYGSGGNYFHINMTPGGKVGGSVVDGHPYHKRVTLRSDPGLADGRWHHAAVTWSGTANATVPGDSTMRLYIDGKLVPSKQNLQMGSVGIGSRCIGARSAESDQFPFNGNLSDLRIYAGGAVLSDTEVAALCDNWRKKGFSTRRAQFDIIDYRAKTDTKVKVDEYFVDMDRVQSAADLEAVPGIKIAWKLPYSLIESLGNGCDVDGDGKIELFVSGRGSNCISRYNQDGQLAWTSEPVNGPLGNESGMAIKDLDGDGKYEIVFNVRLQLWCLDAETGKTNWKIDLPKAINNFQASVVGHFLDRKRYAVVCRVNEDVFCYGSDGAEVWRYRIQNKDFYGHDMAHYDADDDGLDEIYMSLKRKFLALGGDGKLRWADDCGQHSDFILCGDVDGDVDGDGDREIVYDSDGCGGRGPILCRDGRTGKLVKEWIYDQPSHLQKATLGDFDPSQPGLELAAICKPNPNGGLILWSQAGKPAWRKDRTHGWVTWGDWNGDGHPEILLTANGFQVWTGAGKCLYAITGMQGIPLGVEGAGKKRPDLDGNNKADVLLWVRNDAVESKYIVLMEAP